MVALYDDFDVDWLKRFKNEHLVRRQPLWELPRRHLRVSAAGTKCPRSLTFQAMGHSVPFEPRVIRIFETGKLIEQVNVQLDKEAGLCEEGSPQLVATLGGQQKRVLRPKEGAVIEGRYRWLDPVLRVRASDPFLLPRGCSYDVGNRRLDREDRVLAEDVPEELLSSFEPAGLAFIPTGAAPPLVGHVDEIVRRPSDQTKVLIEYKSINQTAFDKLPTEHPPMRASDSPLLKTHYNYVAQLNTYLYLPEVDLELGALVFEAKNTQHQKHYWFERDWELYQKVLKVMELAVPYVLAQPQLLAPVPEERRPLGRDGVCGQCRARYLCRKLVEDHGNTAVAYDKVRKADARLRG